MHVCILPLATPLHMSPVSCAGEATLEQDLGKGLRRPFSLMQCSFVFASAACALKHLHTRLWDATAATGATGLAPKAASGQAAAQRDGNSRPTARLLHGNITAGAMCRCFDGGWRLQGCLDLGAAAGQVRPVRCGLGPRP